VLLPFRYTDPSIPAQLVYPSITTRPLEFFPIPFATGCKKFESMLVCPAEKAFAVL
jgi:hypothetical protein